MHRHAAGARNGLPQPHESGCISRGIYEEVQRPTLWVEGRELHGRTDPGRDPEELLGIDLVLRPFELESGPARWRSAVTTAAECDDTIPDEAQQRLARRAVVGFEGDRDLPQGRSLWRGRRQRHERPGVQVTSSGLHRPE